MKGIYAKPTLPSYFGLTECFPPTIKTGRMSAPVAVTLCCGEDYRQHTKARKETPFQKTKEKYKKPNNNILTKKNPNNSRYR